MGSLFGGGSSKSTQVNETKLPAWVEKAGQENYNLAKSLASRPYTAYPGTRVAGLTGNEMSAIDMAGQTGAWGSDIDAARGNFARGSAALTAGDIQSYMNPYISGALSPAARELQEAGARNLNDASARAVSAGAFGGSRGRIDQSDVYEKNQQALSDLFKTGYADAFNSALGMAQADKSRALQGGQGFLQTGALGSDLTDADIARLTQTGALQRGVDQASLDTAYSDFTEQRDWDLRGLNTMISALSGTPYNTTTTATATQPGSSPLGQIAGLGTAAMGAYQMFSDRDMKEDRYGAEDPEETLGALASLPVERWRYKPEVRGALNDNGDEHIGPMAQDFAEAFGGDGKTIDIVNGFGVILNALKGLEARTRAA
ncbi:MAG: tail fiber domain-containing protein [Parvibaculum sp.]|nr:tail fiber domain-containing protein [Parvibaculum sp.]